MSVTTTADVRTLPAVEPKPITCPGRVLFTRTRSGLARRAPDGRWDALGSWHNESDADGRERLQRHHRGFRYGQHGPSRHRTCTAGRLRRIFSRNNRRGHDHARAVHAVLRRRPRHRVRDYYVHCPLARGLCCWPRRLGIPALLGPYSIRHCASGRRPLFARSQTWMGIMMRGSNADRSPSRS